MTDQRVFDALPSVARAQQLWGEILRQRDDCDPALLRPVALDRPLMLYGAGALGRMIWDYCAALGIPVEAILDRNADTLRQDPFWQGKPLLRPEQIPAERRQSVLLAICVVTAPYAPLTAPLRQEGWTCPVPVYDVVEGHRDRHPLSNGWFAPPLSPAEEQQIATVLAAFADDQSRAHHLQVLAWRCLRQEWVFPGGITPLEQRFFIPEVLAALSGPLRFFDAGAHQGTVCARAIELFGRRCERLWAAEPDPAHHAPLRRVLQNWGGPWDLLAQPLSDRMGQEGFRCGLGYASQLSPQGPQTETTTLDALGVDPTFLKLHLEGAEGRALRGAEQTLEQHRPVVAATSYHSAEGLGLLPSALLQAYPDGALYTRLHGWCGTGAVLYAMPQKRS